MSSLEFGRSTPDRPIRRANTARRKAPMSPKLKVQQGNPDPIFAAEMRAREEERRRAFTGDFPEQWAKRLERPVLPADRAWRGYTGEDPK